MPRLQLANNAKSTLPAGINSSVTSFTVVDASTFPDAGPFRITIDDEIMEVGTITKGTNTFSGVLRGQEGTTAAAHNSGVNVEVRFTAGVYDELDEDKGRYRSEFGLDGATLVNTAVAAGVASLNPQTTVSQDTSDNAYYLYGATRGVGQRIDATFTATMDYINTITPYVGKDNSPTGNFRLTIFDETAGTTIYTGTVAAAAFTTAPVFKVNTAVTRGHVLQIRGDAGDGAGTDGTNYFRWFYYDTESLQANAFKIWTADGWSTKNDSATHDMRWSITYTTYNTSGTITKTIAPADLKAWGNLKWTQTKPANTDVVCDILDTSDNVLLSDVSSVSDLSSIDISSYASIKTRWTLSRLAGGDTSPQVSNPSWTWEGAEIDLSSPWLVDIDVFLTAISHTNWNTITMASTALVYSATKDSSGAQNAEINFDIVTSAGTWTFEMMHYSLTNRGIYSIRIDGVEVGIIDGYAASGVYNQQSTITGIKITGGKHRLTLKMATKNGSSSGYAGSIQHIQLRRTA